MLGLILSQSRGILSPIYPNPYPGTVLSNYVILTIILRAAFTSFQGYQRHFQA